MIKFSYPKWLADYLRRLRTRHFLRLALVLQYEQGFQVSFDIWQQQVRESWQSLTEQINPQPYKMEYRSYLLCHKSRQQEVYRWLLLIDE